MLINFDFQFTGPDGNVIPNIDTAAHVLAGILFQKIEGIQSAKAYDWAIDLYKNNEINIDNTDAEYLEKGIEQSNLINGVKVPLIRKIKSSLNV